LELNEGGSRRNSNGGDGPSLRFKGRDCAHYRDFAANLASKAKGFQSYLTNNLFEMSESIPRQLGLNQWSFSPYIIKTIPASRPILLGTHPVFNVSPTIAILGTAE
jgi:hypothetical protein